MKHLVIKSNHGNHTGFNRNWTILAKCESLEEVKKELNTAADYLAEKFSYGEIERSALCSDDSEGFEDDLIYYNVISQEDYDNGNFFDGGHHGYASKEISDFFEKED